MTKCQPSSGISRSAEERGSGLSLAIALGSGWLAYSLEAIPSTAVIYFRVLDFKMVGFNGKPLCFCGSDLQIGSQVLPVQDNIRRPDPETLFVRNSKLIYCPTKTCIA